MSRGSKWTLEEDKIMMENYHKISSSDLVKILGRTLNAIQQRGIKLGFAPSAKRVNIKEGLKFARLTAISLSHKTIGYSYWNFQCDCGNTTVSRASDVAAGRISSCGCLAAERYKELYGLPPGHAIKKELFSTYKRNAKVANREFSLTEEQFNLLISQNCFMCGSEPFQLGRINRVNNQGDFKYNGIDRYDNTKGYILENCKPCCGYCNTAKNNMSVELFERWLSKVVRNNCDKT